MTIVKCLLVILLRHIIASTMGLIWYLFTFLFISSPLQARFVNLPILQQQSWFWAFICFINFPIVPPPPSHPAVKAQSLIVTHTPHQEAADDTAQPHTSFLTCRGGGGEKNERNFDEKKRGGGDHLVYYLLIFKMICLILILFLSLF